MNEEMIKLAIKHKLAMAYSVEMVNSRDHLPDTIPDKAFAMAAAMIKRMDEELTTLNAKATQAESQEDFVAWLEAALTAALAKSARG